MPNQIKTFLFASIILFTLPGTVSSQPDAEWQIPLHIQIENKEFVLCFGIHQNATDCFDIGLDSLAPPPAFTPHAVLWIAEFPNTLTRDFRGSNDTTKWELRILNADGITIRMWWDTDSLTLPGSLFLNDTLNMLATDSARFEGDQQITITFQKSVSFVRRIEDNSIPKTMEISNYPNPFSQNTTFEIKLKEKCPIQISIYNSLGQTIQQFSFENRLNFHWDGRDNKGFPVPNGFYLVQIKTPHSVQTQKVYKIY